MLDRPNRLVAWQKALSRYMEHAVTCRCSGCHEINNLLSLLPRPPKILVRARLKDEKRDDEKK
jgi:hypothetical protein